MSESNTKKEKEKDPRVLNCLNKIYALAKEKGIGMGELDNIANMSTGYFARLKREGTSMPSTKALKAVTEALGVSVEYLVNEETDNVNPEDAVCIKFMDKLATKTMDGTLYWDYYSNVGSNTTADMPEYARKKYKELKAWTETVDKRYQNITIELFEVYCTKLEEMNGIVSIMNFKYKDACKYGGTSHPNYAWLYFIGENGSQIIAENSSVEKGNSLSGTFSSLLKIVMDRTNKVDRNLIDKMREFCN